MLSVSEVIGSLDGFSSFKQDFANFTTTLVLESTLRFGFGKLKTPFVIE